MPYKFTVGNPVPPDEFQGRADFIKTCCSRIANPLRLGTCLIGGPRTGKTSLLRYLESDYVLQGHKHIVDTYRVYFPGQSVGRTMKPNQFWEGVLRSLAKMVPQGELALLLKTKLDKSATGIDYFDLEDVFDAFGDKHSPVVLLIDDFESLLINEHFWPPDDFSHHVRSLLERQPRGMSWIIASPRPIYDLWDSTKGASPFYNSLMTVELGEFKDEEIREVVREGFKSMGVASNDKVEELVINASQKHPLLVNFVASFCGDCIKNGHEIDGEALETAFAQPDSPATMLCRRIREQLSPFEKELLDKAVDAGPQRMSPQELNVLRRLKKGGLLPPGTVIP